MPIPDYETLMLPLLCIASTANGHEVHLLSAIGQLAEEYKLTDLNLARISVPVGRVASCTNEPMVLSRAGVPISRTGGP